MATAIEAMGMALPYSSSTPADDPLKTAECKLAGEAILNLLKLDLKPRSVMTILYFLYLPLLHPL
jgi:dihydroxy-acid dehydratase